MQHDQEQSNIMADLTEITQVIQDTYSNIWRVWYANHPGCIPAMVTVDLDCTSAGYGHDLNRIIISFGDGNLDDTDILDSGEWQIWKIQLIHEMLHEYEKKVLTAPSDAGRALFAAESASFRRLLWGAGHEELLYTAICDRAPSFGLTPGQLISHI